MYLVTKSLKFDKEKVIGNLLSTIKKVIDMDFTGTDISKLHRRITDVETGKAKLLDVFLSGVISKEEFSMSRAKCDAEIAELQSRIDSVGCKESLIVQKQNLMEEIKAKVNEIIDGVKYEDAFYKQILDRMVINSHESIDVYLKLLPFKWSYTISKASKCGNSTNWNIFDTSIPTSVSMPVISP